MPKAKIREQIEHMEGVTRTWFEWVSNEDGDLEKTLVIEVVETDPNEYAWSRSLQDAITSTAKDFLANETTMVVSRLKIVPALDG